VAIAGFYKDWLHGGGLASKNVLSYGEFPSRANDYGPSSLMMPRGAIINGDLSTVHDVDLEDRGEILEYVAHSWYRYADETKGLHPYDGVTEPNFDLGPNFKGTKTHIEQVDEGAKYSWIKAPRWKGNAMEVGPLSRYVIGYAKGIPEFKEPTDRLLTTLGVPVTALFSTLGRTAARGLEAQWAAHKLSAEFDKLMAAIKAGDTATANTSKWEPSTWPNPCRGVGFAEAPRGALGHWMRIEDGKIASYQCIVPTTWNGGPRDGDGNIGPFEASLLDTPVADAKQPLEILRTLHSFDPCLACSTHVLSPDGNELTRVEVR
jgi:hydrogenase large subunit